MGSSVEVFGGAAIQRAVGAVTVRGGDGGAGDGSADIAFAVGGRVEQELARRGAEFDEDVAVRGGAIRGERDGSSGGGGGGYTARYYGGRKFVGPDDVADSVLTRAGAVAPLRESLRSAAPMAKRVAEKRGYILAGIAQMEALADDPLVEPDVLAAAVEDLTELAASSRKRAVAADAAVSATDATDASDAAASAAATDMPIVPIAPIDVRRQPAPADDPVAVRNLESRMAYHLAALEAWAVELTRRVEAARRALERAD